MDMNVEVCHEYYTKELLRANPDKIYVFGDNMIRRGYAGQAVIRDEPNAFGISTKRYPSMRPEAFYADRRDELDRLGDDLITLYSLMSEDGHTIVFPADGVGTGLAKLKEKSPQIWETLKYELWTHFGYLNGGGNE